MTGPALAFVGDIHGSDHGLSGVLRRFGGQREMVFLGDYVNRGPDSRRVIQRLLAARRLWPGMITLLRGNHDQAFIDFLNDGDLSRFARMGGLATIASYTEVDGQDLVGTFRRAVPRHHIELLLGLQDYFEREDVFASHCGPAPARPRDRQRELVATGSNTALFAEPFPGPLGKQIVCGHYIQRKGQVHVTDWLAAIDTGHGSVPGAPLAVFLWPERDVILFGGE